MYDYEFRNYMPDIGRFASTDPMMDFVNYQSPYVYGDNNPVIYMDENGLGVFRFLGNLFGRGARAIGSLFAGSSCSCNSGGSKSLADSWNQPDFPGVNAFINDLLDGNGGSNNNRGATATAGTSGEGQRGKLDAIELGSAGLVMNEINFEISEINIPNYYTPLRTKHSTITNPTAIFENKKIIRGATINFNKLINFSGNSDEFVDNKAAERTLNSLIKTLKDYPQLKVAILSNTSSDDSDSRKTRNSLAVLNNKITTVGGLQLARGNAILRFLTRRGINPSRISVGYGDIKHEGASGRTTKFIIKN